MRNKRVQSACESYLCCYLNYDENKILAQRLGVKRLPTLMIADSQRRYKMHVGYMGIWAFLHWLEE